jgi:hypothetical protein
LYQIDGIGAAPIGQQSKEWRLPVHLLVLWPRNDLMKLLEGLPLART